MQPSCQWVTRNLNAAEWDFYLPAGMPYHRTCPDRPVHSSLIEAARDLARAGQIDEAIAQLQYLLTVDSTLDLDPAAEAQRGYQEAVQTLLDQAREEAQAGDVEAATATLEQAVTLDPTLILDPQKEAQRLAQPTFENSLAAAIKAAQNDDTETAQAKFDEAAELAGSLDSAESWHALCDAGTRHGLAETVLDACDKAIELEPDNGLYYNSRGIARLQLGDQPGAQEDFAKFEAWLEEGQR
jgi:tetratricopeptide (TPR) repeat protein